MHVRVPIKRPKFYDFFAVETETTRICSQENCDNPARFVGGHYAVNGRRVRVWVCKDHKVANPLQELPVPQDILAGLAAEVEHADKMNLYYRQHGNLDADHGVSVKAFAATGHGNPIPGDRVKAWRWGA